MAQITQSIPTTQLNLNRPKLLGWAILLASLTGVYLLSQTLPALETFSDSWNLGLRDTLNEFKRWVVVNRNTHWMFVYFFEPFSATVDFSVRRVEDVLLWLPWPIVILTTFLIAERISGLRLALLTLACLLPMGMFGLWEESMQTFALMIIAVGLTLLIGLPLGIWSARSEWVERLLRPILDAMQTMPAFVYLIPVLLFFGVARVPSIVATIIYALPPIIRLTSLGIRSVPAEAIEAAKAFGSTDRQLLRKVQLPLALPTIMVGVNQTIMMALSIVVIAALIGAGGLGDVVLKSLRRLQVGAALEAGLAIVLMAILLDRLSRAVSRIEFHSTPRFQGFRLLSETWRGNFIAETVERGIATGYAAADGLRQQVAQWLPNRLKPQATWLTMGLSLLTLTLLLRLSGLTTEFPDLLRVEVSRPVDDLVRWMQINLYNIADSGIGTGPLRDFLIIRIFHPLRDLLTTTLPWSVILCGVGYLAWRVGGWRLAISLSGLTVCIGLFGMWEFAMDTLGQTLVAVTICVLIGIPLGILAAHNDWLDRLLQPLLDLLQTIPIFVYLVPVIMLFGTGSVAGLIASVLYAVVPVTRLTNAGIRSVDRTIQESAQSFGSTSWQTLLKVEIPLALPSIMLGINQTIMMVLAMVIIAGLIGATGLGLEVYQGFANDNLGRSVEAGLAIVLLAIIIDRITQQVAQRAKVAANVV